MNNFFKGILVGVGIGLLVAPMRGEEMRQRLNDRLNNLRGYLPENEQLNDYVQQVSDRVSTTASNVKDYAQQAVSRVRDSGSDVADLTKQAASEVKSGASDVADTTKSAARSAKNSSQGNSTSTGTTSYTNY